MNQAKLNIPLRLGHADWLLRYDSYITETTNPMFAMGWDWAVVCVVTTGPEGKGFDTSFVVDGMFSILQLQRDDPRLKTWLYVPMNVLRRLIKDGFIDLDEVIGLGCPANRF